MLKDKATSLLSLSLSLFSLISLSLSLSLSHSPPPPPPFFPVLFYSNLQNFTFHLYNKCYMDCCVLELFHSICCEIQN